MTDKDVEEIGVRFAEMETALMELDRARAIYEHISQFSNPNEDGLVWKRWRDFEISHGAEDTFREMLRKKRAVASQFEEANSLKFDPETLRRMEEEARKELQATYAPTATSTV